MKTPLLTLTIALLLLEFVAFCNAADWTTDYEAALKKADAQHRMVLLNFTGDDAYGYGRLLDHQVLAQTSFAEFADKKLVLVAVDSKPGANLSDNLKLQNDALVSQFHISGFPTLVLVASTGKEVWRQEGYDPAAGPGAVIGKLKSYSNK